MPHHATFPPFFATVPPSPSARPWSLVLRMANPGSGKPVVGATLVVARSRRQPVSIPLARPPVMWPAEARNPSPPLLRHSCGLQRLRNPLVPQPSPRHLRHVRIILLHPLPPETPSPHPSHSRAPARAFLRRQESIPPAPLTVIHSASTGPLNATKCRAFATPECNISAPRFRHPLPPSHVPTW